MRRAQTEIFGLAIVVLLISVGFLFAVGFFVQKPSTFKKEFALTEIGANLLNALLKVTVMECNNLEMTELIQDCAENDEANQIDCDPTTPTIDGSCQSIQGLIPIIFFNTLDKWGYIDNEGHKKYKLTMEIKNPQREVITPIGEDCSGAKKASPPEF